MNKIKILIVDDYEENIKALAGLIEAPDVDIQSTTSADEALELIEQYEFGLLLLDVQMPEMSGFELAKIIRGVKKFRSLPIIFVTAQSDSTSVIFEGYKSGAVDLLFKPLDPNIVRAKVQLFVEMAQQKNLLQMQVQELDRLRVEADAANIAKSQFLANMSHEIRTPLGAVLGFSELIARSLPENTETREMSAAVERNGSLLLRLIDDILDLAKIEANKLEFEKIEFDLGELLRDIHTTLSFRANEKGLCLSFKVPAEISIRYISDPTRIKQVLLNIIGNAIKFTSVGTVEIDISMSPESRDTGVKTDGLSVNVKDQGVGLSVAQAERLFQPFGQADSSTRRQFGGSGLGLVISRQIARAMGGDVKLLSSEPGQGSVFQIRFDIERSTSASLAEHSETKRKESLSNDVVNIENLKGKKILVVDDSSDNLTLISLFLDGSSAEILFAKNGNEAIEQFKKHNFDLILMDVQMPGINGYEATEEIRRLGFMNPIIALTAHAIRSEHEKCRASGCNSVLIKPINRTNLMRELNNHLR
jgi:signal transduction histidine kinase